ncbi:MAG: recombination-associated protein RdgC [Desulfobacterales bacterium]|nr:recombination-associated protein RdgC [Desulfobacterales bacterium]
MGLLSTSVSVTRYRVEGKLDDPVMETVAGALSAHIIDDIDNEPTEKVVGWTSFETPFIPNFDNFAIGTHFVFSLRMDKKTIPAKVLKKYFELEMTRLLAESGREFMARSEKSQIRERVMERLYLKIPATPNVYDIVWNYESSDLWFFTNLKAANEELETLFSKTFKMTLIRLFPFTMADLTCGLSESSRDSLSRLSPSRFTG